MGVGSKVRKLRKELGLTVKAAAARAGLTTSMLSQVERDLVAPSISSLRRLASALNVPAFYFLIEDAGFQDIVVRREERRTLRLPGYNATYQLLSPNLEKRVEMMYFELPPGEMTSEAPMAHDGEENLVVTGGRLRVVLPDKEVLLDVGDSIFFERSVPHQIVNVGETSASAICAISPPSF